MGLYQWLLFFTYVLISVICDLHAESLERSSAVEDDGSLSTSIFGFRPCMDESCSGPSLENIMSDSSNTDYEPQHHDTVSPIPDPVIKHCLRLHLSTIEKASLIDDKHPDVSEVKVNIIEGLIKYTSDYASIFKTSDCAPEVKLLDFIVFAAETLKQDYVKAYGGSCEYSVVGDEEADRRREEAKAASTSTTPRVTTVQSTTPGYVSTSAVSEAYQPTTKGYVKTGSTVGSTPYPDHAVDDSQTEEIIAEEDIDGHLTPILVGSIKGIPGVHFPNYTDVPITSFGCADKKYMPGFYADQETGCQVFHVCYEHRRESFLCPVGTTFNQPILACDYWYSSNCSLAAEYYEVNEKSEEVIKEEDINVVVDQLIDVLEDKKKAGSSPETKPHVEVNILQFLPVKATVTEFSKPVVKGQEAALTVKTDVQAIDEVASEIFNDIVSTATKVVSKTRDSLGKIPDPGEATIKSVMAEKKLAKAKLASVPVTKVAAKTAAVMIAKLAAAKAASAVFPLAKAASAAIPVATMKTVPVVAKAKLASTIPAKVAAVKTVPAKVVLSTAGLGVAKGKVAAAVPKVAIPLVKTKMFAPIASTKAKVVPTLKIKAKFLPVVKSKIVSAPLLKTAKVATAAAISPLTKKTLALGYMKLLKAKKLALMG